jgi:hypothetical protein
MDPIASASIMLPNARVQVLQPDGSLTLPWRRALQSLSASGSVSPAVVNAIIAELTALETAVAALSIQVSELQSEIGAQTPSLQAQASAALVAGQVVNVFDSGGAAMVQPANATDLTKPAHGFVKANWNAGELATIQLGAQFITGLSLSPGATYWLDVTDGAYVTSPPATPGQGTQVVGLADYSGSQLFFFPGPMLGSLRSISPG